MPESTCSVGFFFQKIRSVVIYIIWTGHYRENSENSQILMQTAACDVTLESPICDGCDITLVKSHQL